MESPVGTERQHKESPANAGLVVYGALVREWGSLGLRHPRASASRPLAATEGSTRASSQCGLPSSRIRATSSVAQRLAVINLEYFPHKKIELGYNLIRGKDFYDRPWDARLDKK
jgi:hypothetical protein